MATVTVTMIAPDGQRHAVTVEAKSLYTAIFQYNYLSHDRPRGLPKPERSSIFEVQPKGGFQSPRDGTPGPVLSFGNLVEKNMVGFGPRQRMGFFGFCI